MSTNFDLVSAMNVAFGNERGNPLAIDWSRVRSQSLNVLDEFIELMSAFGLESETMAQLKAVRKRLTADKFSPNTPDHEKVRDTLCDIHVYAYGAHHLMGINADEDTIEVVEKVMTRFIKDDADKAATQAMHAAAGVTQVSFEGEYPTMIMRSTADQPDAPVGKFMKSASFQEPVFPAPGQSRR